MGIIKDFNTQVFKSLRIFTTNKFTTKPTSQNHDFQNFNIQQFIFKLCKNILLQLCLSRPNESVSEYISILYCKPQIGKRGGLYFK